MTLVQIIKSKTLGFNTVAVAIFGLLAYIGIDIPAEVTTGVLAIGNYILRFFTKKPIAEK